MRPQIFQALDQCEPYPYSRSEYAKRFAWRLVEIVFIRLSPSRAYVWRRFWLRLFGARISPLAGTKPSTRVYHPWLLEMGDYSVLSDNVVVYNLGDVRIGSHTVVSQESYLCSGTHDYERPTLPLLRKEIEIGDGVWIGARAFIGPAVRIGHNAVIGACAVVFSDVPIGVVVAGNPARVIKTRAMAEGGRDSTI